MPIKAVYDTEADIPAAHKELFTERNGKWELTQVEGIKTQGDVDRLQTALTNERNEHKSTRDKLTPWSTLGKKPEEIQAQLDRVAELELLTKDKDPAAIEALVETRIKSRLAPVERERDQLKTTLAEKDGIINGFETKERTRTIHDTVRQAASKVGMLPSAIDDALLYGERVLEVDTNGNVVTKDGVGVTPGLAPDVWLGDLKNNRPHWWGQTQGGGGSGGGGGARFPNNPFSAEHWNLTQQGAAIKADRTKAEQMAKAAGTTIGGPKPAAKK